MPNKIVIADAMEDEVVAKIRTLGEVDYQPSDIKASLADANALVVRSATKVSAELIAEAKNLKVVARAGVGLDNVDKAACAAKNIAVINTPAASTLAVAELTVGLAICLLRNVGRAHAGMKAGVWDKKNLTGSEITGKTLGLVGFGRIGRLVAEKATALGMQVVYTDPKIVPGPYAHFNTVDEMLPNADIISFHASVPKGSPPLLTAERIAKMKKGAYIINTARGALIDEAALVAAMRSGHIAGAALDVFQKEPYSGELASLDNVILTPHIGASTNEAQARIGEDLISQLRQMLSG